MYLLVSDGKSLWIPLALFLQLAHCMVSSCFPTSLELFRANRVQAVLPARNMRLTATYVTRTVISVYVCLSVCLSVCWSHGLSVQKDGRTAVV